LYKASENPLSQKYRSRASRTVISGVMGVASREVEAIACHDNRQ
jgi:hypothetical protein